MILILDSGHLIDPILFGRLMTSNELIKTQRRLRNINSQDKDFYAMELEPWETISKEETEKKELEAIMEMWDKFFRTF